MPWYLPRPCLDCGLVGGHGEQGCPNWFCVYCKSYGHLVTHCPIVPPCNRCQKKGHRTQHCKTRLTYTPEPAGRQTSLASREQPYRSSRHGRLPREENFRHSAANRRSMSPGGTRSTLGRGSAQNTNREAERGANRGSQAATNAHSSSTNVDTYPTSEQRQRGKMPKPGSAEDVVPATRRWEK